jgi:hypothetical protein
MQEQSPQDNRIGRPKWIYKELMGRVPRFVEYALLAIQAIVGGKAPGSDREGRRCRGLRAGESNRRIKVLQTL